MKPKTFMIESEAEDEIRQFAKVNDMNDSQVIRQAIREFLQRKTKKEFTPIKYCGCGNSLVTEQEQRDGICKECI